MERAELAEVMGRSDLELRSVGPEMAEDIVRAVARLANSLPAYEVLVSVGGGHFKRDLESLAVEHHLVMVNIECLIPRCRWIARLIPSHGATYFVPNADHLPSFFSRTAPYSLWGLFLVPTRMDPGLRRLIENSSRDQLFDQLWLRSDVAGYTFDLDNSLGNVHIGRDVPSELRGLPRLGAAV